MLKSSTDLQFPKLNWVSACPEVPCREISAFRSWALHAISVANLGRWKAMASRYATRKVGWRFNSKPRVTATRTAPHRSVTRLESFRSAWISDRPVAPASLVSERRDRHSVASSTSLLPLDVFTLVILEPSRLVSTSHVYMYTGCSNQFLDNERLAISLSKLWNQFLLVKISLVFLT